jgi:NAD+ kinase
MMPVDLVLVRHGESEGNVAGARSKRGDHSAYTPAFRARHSSQWRLTAAGREQASQAGAWIRHHLGSEFGRYYTSEYIRAMETAALLDLPGATWFADFNLRERDWGEMDVMPDDERRARFGDSLARKAVEPFYWRPPNGEHMAELCLRLNRVLETLHRECGPMRVIITCHGEVMWAFRVLLERMSQRRYAELDRSADPFDRIHNCQILQYTRRDPKDPGRELTAYGWFRSTWPLDPSRSRNTWEAVARPSYRNEELMQAAAAVPPLVE